MLSPILTIIGLVFAIGFASTTCAWTFRTLKRRGFGEILAATVCGLAATVVAAAVFIALRIHLWFGPETDWRFSAFLGVCVGIWYAVMHRGDGLIPRTSHDDERGA
jgi:hypothetical protein